MVEPQVGFHCAAGDRAVQVGEGFTAVHCVLKIQMIFKKKKLTVTATRKPPGLNVSQHIL